MPENVKERPVLMSGPMARMTLTGRKTQTRRVVKGAEKYPNIVKFERWIVQDEPQYRESGMPLWVSTETDGTTREWGCPYGEVGDRLWVRETFYCNSFDYPEATEHARENLLYRADAPHELEGESVEIEGGGWKPSIHMPRWVSRLTLEITDIRVEQLQDITEEDAQQEGCSSYCIKDGDGFKQEIMSPVEAFEELWDSINGKRGFGWEADPWVFVISFRRIEPSS